MDEYADIYYVDSRNASSRDHRTNTARPGWIPPPPARASTQTVYLPQRPMPMTQPVIYAQPAPTSSAAMLLGKLTTGQIVEIVAQIFAALQSLPGAPVATRDASTDVANLILYQGALASHAKRDEQVRTLGSLVAKLVG